MIVRRRVSHLLTATVLSGLIATSCGTAEPETIAAADTTTSAVDPRSFTEPCDQPEFIVDLAMFNMNMLATTMEFAIVGEVVAISEPWWNTISGLPKHDEDLIEPTRPGYTPLISQFRTVTVEVERVVASRTAAPEPGSRLEIVVIGSGVARGCRHWGDVDGEVAAGPIAVGETNLMMLASGAIPFEGERRAVIELVSGDYRANWRVSGDQAIAALSVRTVGLTALEQRIIDEVERGPIDPSGDLLDTSFDDPLAPVVDLTELPDDPPVRVEAPCVGEFCNQDDE